MGRHELGSRGKSSPCRIKAQQEQILVIRWWCWTSVSSTASSRLENSSTDPAEELDLAQLGLMTCMDLAVPREALTAGQGGGGGDGITAWDGDPPSWGGDPPSRVMTHPNLLLLSHFGTIMASHGTHIPGEVSGCRGASWGPVMLRAGRSPWHLWTCSLRNHILPTTLPSSWR